MSLGMNGPPLKRSCSPAFDAPVFSPGRPVGVSSGSPRPFEPMPRSDTGMFCETREPFAIGTRVKVTFSAPGKGNAEMTLEAEVRYQCFINFTRGKDSQRAGMRGVGLKFVAPVPVSQRRGSLH